MRVWRGVLDFASRDWATLESLPDASVPSFHEMILGNSLPAVLYTEFIERQLGSRANVLDYLLAFYN